MDLKEKVEHACVGGPAGQGASRGVGPYLAQRPQQLCDAAPVAEAGLCGRVAVEQGTGRVVGPYLAQRRQQLCEAPRIVEAGLGGGLAGQGRGRGVGPGLVQRPQQPFNAQQFCGAQADRAAQMISSAGSDRECSPVLTASTGP